MATRHDSLLEPEVKDYFSYPMDMPSSPLSPVPSNLESQLVPSDLIDPTMDTTDTVTDTALEDLSMGTSLSNQEMTTDSDEHDTAPVDMVAAGQGDTVPVSTQISVRRSERKRKPSKLYSGDTNSSQYPTSGSDTASGHEDAEQPAKKQKRSTHAQAAAVKTSYRTRGTGRAKSDPTTSSEPIKKFFSVQKAVSVDANSQTPTEEPEVDAPTTESSPKSLIVKLKFSPENHNKLTQPMPAPVLEPVDIPTETSNTTDSPGVDLVMLSKALTQYVPIDQKPLPRGQPEVWAEERPELCKTLCGIYDSYQGGFSGKGGVAKGFLLDGNSHSRDFVDENVIILRAGGGMEKDEETGKMVICKDQELKSHYISVNNVIAQQSPVVIISGNKNDLAPSRMPHRYQPLDWYKPTHAWTEMEEVKSGKHKGWKKIIKFRFEKLNANSIGWWVPEGASMPVQLGSLDPPVKHRCTTCNHESEQRYLGNWMCLNHECDDVWILPDGSRPDPSVLIYDPRFLKQKTPWVNEEPPMSLRFPLYVPSPIPGENYKDENMAGMACPQCGRCNERIRWDGWVCANCTFEHKTELPILPASAIQDQKVPVSDAYASSNDWAMPEVNVSTKFSHNYRWVSYKFQVSETEEAEVLHGIANKTVREEQGGPNEMWENMQQNSDDMIRRKMTKGRMRAFSMNYGMPYKFVASGESVSFDDAPWPIRETLSRLNWANRENSDSSVGEETLFNELLVLGYFEDSSINFHDDGEKGLGDTVATLSIGAPAEMIVRPKGPYYHGVKRVIRQGQTQWMMTTDKPLPGFPVYEDRLKYYNELNSTNLTKEEKEKKLMEYAKKLMEAAPKQPTTAPPHWIKLWLAHGDIVIMRGAQFQKYFEHSVSCKGLMRYALTCRTILPEHLKPSELPNYEVKPDQGNYDGSRIAR